VAAERLIRICDAASLDSGGRGMRFDVTVGGLVATGFVLRWRGRAVAYLNQCVHVAMELDWIQGEFLDGDREFIVCATHGAIYDPDNGRCLGGPCQGRGGLRRIAVTERDSAIWWTPDTVVKASAEELRRQSPSTLSPDE
jgi:nitrite reductase/ring-hydroxylating ferredoxin subunit